jgi:hypothetical protein
LEEITMAKKNVRTEIRVTAWENGQQVWRTVDTLQGDVSGTMIVPSVEQARADLKHDWAKFDRVLNTHGKTLSDEARGAIGDATAAIEGGNRWLANALLFAALGVLNDHAMGTYFTVPPARVAPMAEDDD